MYCYWNVRMWLPDRSPSNSRKLINQVISWERVRVVWYEYILDTMSSSVLCSHSTEYFNPSVSELQILPKKFSLKNCFAKPKAKLLKSKQDLGSN